MSVRKDMERKERMYNAWLNSTRFSRDAYMIMLRQYCNNKSDGFIRDFATKNGRVIARDIEKIFNKMVRECYELNRNPFISVYEYKDINKRKNLPDYNTYKGINKVVFDIDCDDGLENGWPVAKDIVNAIEKKVKDGTYSKGKYEMFFTGGRGFHIYYVPNDIFLTNSDKLDFCNDIYKSIEKPDVVDTSLFGDVSRDIRIPYTIHPGTYRQMIKVNRDDSIENIVRRSKKVRAPKTPIFGGEIV